MMDQDLDRGAAAAGSTPPDRHQPPPGARLMSIVRWSLFGGLLLLALLSVGSYLMSRTGEGAVAKTGQQGRVYYRCPMHPNYTSDKPGDCPICGMSLEKVVETAPEHTHSAQDGDVPGLMGVTITPERQQRIGVRTAVVQRRTLGSETPLVGIVTPDESRIRRIQLRVSGWIEQLHVSRVGDVVRTGQTLLHIYSPELYQSEREFLIELEAAGSPESGHGTGAATLEAARRRLALLGVPEVEIRRLERERTPSTRLTLTSPVTGTVLERGAVEGQYVGPDTPLMTVADLSQVWVLADVYEMDLGRVRAGDPATFEIDATPRRQFKGRIDFVYPTVSSQTRTLKARMSLPNPGGVLRPGMYGRVHVQARRPATFVLPTEAVVNTGEHRYVFLAHADGRFEPRMVQTGDEQDDWIEVLGGVAEGDTVVASASFLIDSESRLRAAVAGMGAQPSTGHAGHGGTP